MEILHGLKNLKKVGVGELYETQNCPHPQGFDSLEGSGSVTVAEAGTYKIAMAADVINRGVGSVTIGLVSAGHI